MKSEGIWLRSSSYIEILLTFTRTPPAGWDTLFIGYSNSRPLSGEHFHGNHTQNDLHLLYGIRSIRPSGGKYLWVSLFIYGYD